MDSLTFLDTLLGFVGFLAFAGGAGFGFILGKYVGESEEKERQMKWLDIYKAVTNLSEELRK